MRTLNIFANLLAFALGAAIAVACTPPVSLTLPTVVEDSTQTNLPETATPLPVVSDTPGQVSSPSPLPSSTPTSTPEPTTTSTATPTELPMNVKGDICYPGASHPAMIAYFEETNTGTVVELPITADQDSYEIKLGAGAYIAYAWLADFSKGGLYSRAVTCGMSDDCDDHTVQTFTVVVDQIQVGIDLCDWYAGPFNVPYPPGKDVADLTGGISGRLAYRDGPQPELRVVAFSTETGYYYWVYTQPGQANYGIQNLPPGTYHVVAYDPQGRAGGYTSSGHHLIDVQVNAGELTEGADITDWGAPEGAFPLEPSR